MTKPKSMEVMMKRGKLLCLSLLCLTVFVVAGCASNVPLAKKDLESVKEITFARYPSGYWLDSTRVTVVAVTSAVPVWFIMPMAAAAVYHGSSNRMMSDAGEQMQAKFNLPDFAELVQKGLFEKLRASLPGSTKLIYDEKPIDGTFRKTTDGLLTMETIVKVEDDLGFRTVVTVELTDSENTTLWKRKFWYNSIDHDRTSIVPLLFEDGGKKLKEEVAYAAQLTIADLMDDFNGYVTHQGGQSK